MSQIFYKKNESDKIWWIKDTEQVGNMLFSFDKETIYNLFRDYPEKLTPEQKKIFDMENKFWVDYFNE